MGSGGGGGGGGSVASSVGSGFGVAAFERFGGVASGPMMGGIGVSGR